LALIDEQRCIGAGELYLAEVSAQTGSIQGLEIDGPYSVTGAGDTPSRRAIFVCHPAQRSEEEETRGVTHAVGNVLVVDDERLVRWALRERLVQAGHRIVEAGSIAEAFAQLQGRLDLVLLDLRLPDGDGLIVLRAIQAQSPDTPVVLMTAFSDVKDATEAVGLGAYDLVCKPFNLDDVALVVARGLEVGRLRRQTRQPPDATG
jgi:CheY-like chemotaxis protein